MSCSGIPTLSTTNRTAKAPESPSKTSVRRPYSAPPIISPAAQPVITTNINQAAYGIRSPTDKCRECDLKTLECLSSRCLMRMTHRSATAYSLDDVSRRVFLANIKTVEYRVKAVRLLSGNVAAIFALPLCVKPRTAGVQCVMTSRLPRRSAGSLRVVGNPDGETFPCTPSKPDPGNSPALR